MAKRLKQFMQWFRHRPVKSANCLITTRRGKVILDSSGWEDFEIEVQGPFLNLAEAHPGDINQGRTRLTISLTQLIDADKVKNFQVTEGHPRLGVKR